MPLGEGRQAEANLLGLQTHRRQRGRAKTTGHLAIEQIVQARGDGHWIGRFGQWAVGKFLKHGVQQRAEIVGGQFLGRVGQRLQIELMPQIILIGAGQVIAQLGHP